jgi:DNA-binding transcriptional MerR regulator
MKRAGGRRFYRPQDIRVLHGVRRLLHDEGHSIKDVQRLHRERGVKGLLDPSAARPAAAPSRATARRDSGFLIASLGDLRRLGPERLAGALEKLQAAKQRLDAVLHQA